MLRLALPLLVLAVATPAAARRAAPPKLHFVVQVVDAVPSAPAELSVKAKSVLNEIVAARPEFVQTIEGAPDPTADPEGYRKLAEKKHIAPYSVTLKISEYERSLAPNSAPGKSGQVLTIKLSLSLVGTKFPTRVLALAGSGGATVTSEVGANLRPREEESTMDDALRSALTKAVDESVAELRKGSTPSKKRR